MGRTSGSDRPNFSPSMGGAPFLDEARQPMGQAPWAQGRGQEFGWGRRPSLPPQAMARNNYTAPSGYAPGSHGQGRGMSMTPDSLPISTTGSVAGTGASPVGPAAEGGSGISDPASIAGAQPNPATSAAPANRPKTNPQELIKALRAG